MLLFEKEIVMKGLERIIYMEMLMWSLAILGRGILILNSKIIIKLHKIISFTLLRLTDPSGFYGQITIIIIYLNIMYYKLCNDYSHICGPASDPIQSLVSMLITLFK